MDREEIIASTRLWVERLVVDLNLCPFAKRELVKNRVRFSVTDAATEAQLVADLRAELAFLQDNPSTETTLLIHPKVLQDFFDYNQFLDEADYLLEELDLEGIVQIASFHPHYQFGGTQPGDAENYTNRSPYPILHLLREESLEQAIANYPDSDEIPEHNIERMNALGGEHLGKLLQSCLQPAANTD